MTTDAPTLSREARQDILDREVAKYARQGYAVTSSTFGSQAILQRRARVKWLWMVILSILTVGLFLLVVLFRIVNRKVETVILTVDDRGRVRTQRG